MDARASRRTGLVVLALCFALSMLGRGLIDSFGVFLLPIVEAFGWDRAQVISIYSVALLSSGLSLPLVGRLFDRHGPRVVYGLGLALLGAAFAVAATARMLWQFQLCLGLAAGLGAACLGNVPNSILLVRWFGPRLPTAMAVAFSGAGAGVLTMLPLSQLLIDGFGWRGAYRVLGGAILVLLVPLLLLPWGLFSAGAPAIARHARPSLGGEGWTLLRALRHQAFWALFCTFFFTAVGMFCIAVQVVAYLVDVGFPPLQAATAWGFSGVLVLIGMLTISSLDRLIGRRPSVLLSYAFTIAGIVMLWLLARFPNGWLLAGFVGCFGSTIGSRGPLITAEAMEIFRGERVGTIYGAISLGGGLGSALGSWSGGLLHDWSGYGALIGFALVNVVLGAMPFLVVPALRRPAGK
ncbi:MAG: MFS transporter [Xanthobacteraceae bacterium]